MGWLQTSSRERKEENTSRAPSAQDSTCHPREHRTRTVHTGASCFLTSVSTLFCLHLYSNTKEREGKREIMTRKVNSNLNVFSLVLARLSVTSDPASAKGTLEYQFAPLSRVAGT